MRTRNHGFRPATACVAVIVAVVLAACGDDAGAPAAGAEAVPSADGYPVTIEKCGRTLVFYPGKSPLYVVGAGIVSELLAEAGAENVFADTPSHVGTSREEVAAHPADAFVILADAAAARTGKLDGTKDAQFMFTTFPNMPASENRRAIVSSGDYVSAGGWRNASVVEILARKLHPDAFAKTSSTDRPVAAAE